MLRTKYFEFFNVEVLRHRVGRITYWMSQSIFSLPAAGSKNINHLEGLDEFHVNQSINQLLIFVSSQSEFHF